MGDIHFSYSPREQFEALHTRNERWACIVFHRRGGKTVATINDMIARAVYTQKENARYAYVAPYYRQAKDVAWTYLKDYVGDAAVKIRESDLRIELFNGAWITLYGADNPDALRGIYLDGVILDEYGDCRPSLWGEVILPTLADRKGWAIFIGTPKGKNHFYDVYKRSQERETWFSLMCKASETGILPDEELSEMRALMSAEQYAQELECSFEAAVQGTFYAAIIEVMEKDERIIPDLHYDPSQPVHVAADLGYRDSTAMWFWQNTPDGIHVVDYHEAQGQSLDYYFDFLDSKPYNYGNIWLPHDAKAKSLQTGRSTVEQFVAWARNQDIESVRIVPKQKVQHGIDAVRYILPRCKINQSTCYEGIEALRAYRRRYDEIRKVYADAPLHDWSSNGADAFRYLSLICREEMEPVVVEKPPEPIIKPPEYTLNKLFAERDQVLSMSRGRI